MPAPRPPPADRPGAVGRRPGRHIAGHADHGVSRARFGVSPSSSTVSPSNAPAGCPTGASSGRMTMPACSSDRPSSFSEQTMPSEARRDLAALERLELQRVGIAVTQPGADHGQHHLLAAIALVQVGRAGHTSSGCSWPYSTVTNTRRSASGAGAPGAPAPRTHWSRPSLADALHCVHLSRRRSAAGSARRGSHPRYIFLEPTERNSHSPTSLVSRARVALDSRYGDSGPPGGTWRRRPASGELLQEAQVVAKEQADVGDAVLQHTRPLGPMPKAKPLHSSGS